MIVTGQPPLVEDLGYKGGSIPGIKKWTNSLSFIVMGDWGRNGENYQKEVAVCMGNAAHDLDAEFVIATGDNFYPCGVESTRDHHWLSSFEQIYTAHSLHVKWYPVLGNHDYVGNSDAEVDYTKVSSRWSMPSRYYSKRFIAAGDVILMVFLDTDPIEKMLQGAPYDSIKYKKGYVKKQIKWLERELADSKARWKFVIGHHPLYTGGWRRDDLDTRNMKEFLEPVFNKHKVDVYVCGHEHHLEYIKPAGPTHYIISGAASEARPVELYPGSGKFAAAVQGFSTFSLTQNELLIQFIDNTGTIINETIICK